MYAVAIFALVLLSPLPFISPFAYDVQDVAAAELTFGAGDQENQPLSLPIITLTEPVTGNITTSSNNTNPAYANAGDTITVNFKANETLHYNATATIHGKYATVSVLGNELNATITILETDPDGYANFEINVSSNSGDISLSEENLSQGTTPVFVDKRIPVITLNGPFGVFVTQGESYTEFGASAIDGDPLYSGTITDNSSSITTGTIGTFIVEYTAPNDGAGNVPFSKTRTVFVQDPSLTASAKHVDNETILLRFNTNQHAFFSGNNTLTSAITVDGASVKSAAISGQIKSITTFDSTTPGLEFIKYYDDFGYAVSPLGDINDDGYEDIMVGIPKHASESSAGGAVAIVHLGENAESILDVFLFDGDSENMPELSKIDNTTLGSRFGLSLENLGDINGDGFTDIAVGASAVRVDGDAFGSVYVLFLGPNGSSVLGYADINSTIHNGLGFGTAITNMGDLNTDGIQDILVSAINTPAFIIENGINTSIVVGSFFIMHLGSDGLPIKTIEYNLSVIQSQVPSFPNHPETLIGVAVENMGDLNHDGYTDVMITSIDSATKDSFIYTIHLGERGETILDISRMNIHGSNFPPDFGPAVAFGSSIAKLNDINGDGYTDMIISAPETPNFQTAGAFYVLSLGANGTSVNGYYEISSATIDDLILEPRNTEFQRNSQIARSIAVLGDLNSNGAPNIVLGANYLNARGGLHVLSFAGYNDNIPHVIIKTNTTDTAKTSNVVIDAVSGDIQLQLVPTNVSTTAEDGVAPRITSITHASNTSLSIEFSETIIADTEFKVDSFRISNTSAIAVVKNAAISGNTVLLNTTVLSSVDTPLIEILDSVIKDGSGNSIEYTAHTVPDTVGPYPINAFWGYDGGSTNIFLTMILLSDDNIVTFDVSGYTINDKKPAHITPVYGYLGIQFNGNPADPLPFVFNQSNLDLILAPRENFVDNLQNIALKNFTIKVDQTLLPARILRAETGDGNKIILTLSKNMADVETTDFTLSDSLSLQSASVERNKIILVTTDQLPSDSTPIITISGNISDTNIGIPRYQPSNITIGTTITVSDGIRPTITSAEYDNYYNLNISYSEPIRKDLISEEDFEITFIDLVQGVGSKDVTQRVITSITTSNDNLSTSLTFDRKLQPNSTLQMSGLMRDITGLAMLKEQITISDTTPPFMSSARTLDTTSIEITFNEDISSTNLNANDFSIDSGSISAIAATVLNNVVRIETDPITADATPVITLIGSVSDIVGNIANSGSVTATDAIAPSLNSLSITSDNINSAFAKSSDTITLTLVANEPVSFLNGHILGKTPQTNVPGNTITASVNIDENTSNGPSVFAITISDGAGNTKTVTELDITASNVNIDTQSPVITLIGSSDKSLTLDATYIDDGSLVTDNDPNYVQTSATVSENINSAVLGASYLVTYSAQADSAGNIPENQTRSVTIVNADPINVTSLSITSSSGTNYANAGKIITLTLTTDGSDLGNIAGTLLGRSFTNTTNGGVATFTVTVQSGDTNENATFSITVTNSSGNQISVTNADITDSSHVTIDTTAPSITLNGENNTIVATNSPYTDPGATATDASYATSSVQVSGTGTVDIATADNYTLTYTAPVDPAGNTGSTITRNVIVQDTLPIDITAFTITTANTNKSYAKAGDRLTLELTVNDTITTYTGQILNTNPDTLFAETYITLLAFLNTPNNATESNATFTFTVTNINGTTLTVTEDNLTGPNVFVDTIPPNITLIGSANGTIVLGSTYADPGATAKDGDPNYSGTYTATVNPPLDTSILGAVFVYTYTADADNAGNLGDSISRTVTVVDVKPINVTSLSIASSSGNNFANAGKIITLTLDTDGSDLGNFTGSLLDRSFTNTTNGGVATFTVTVQSGDTNENATFSITMTNSSGNQISVTNANITDRSYVTIDTTAPSITLNGANNTIVIRNQPYEDPNATASDASYATDSVQVSGTGNLDITTNAIYTLTYTAPDDPAGNIGPVITRTVTVQDAPPIKINILTFTSSNQNTQYAKAGDVLTLTLVINDTITSDTVQIQNGSLTTNSSSSSTLAASRVIPTSTIESNATFTITVTNANGVTLTVTENDLTGSNVFVDTIPPNITLIGPADSGIVLDSEYTDPGATAKDGDPNYSGTYNTTINGTFSTAIPGAIYEYTYTAHDDNAGNPGDNTTRIVRIVDVDPINVTLLTIKSSSGTNYANAGKIITLTLATDGSDLGNFTGTLLGRSSTNTTNGGNATFTVTVQLGDTNENATFSITVTNSSGNQISIITTDTTDGSFVTIDTIKPVIVLTGGAGSVFQGETYQDPGTTISDSNNASYAGSVSNTSLNTAILGPQNITYTGTADVAGNEPDQQTRTVTVFAKPLGLNSLTIESNNVNTSFAKDGDVIIVTLATNGTIDYIVGTIANNPVAYTVTGNNASATVTVAGTFVDTASVTFLITAYNEDNSTFTTFTNRDLTGSNIAIDTTAPSITLNGENNTRVATNSPYTDPGATATDASYATSSVQVSGAGNVNTAIVGNYTLTYTAPDDPAGNTGSTITRNVIVQDTLPIGITEFTITSFNTNKSYAKAGDRLDLELTVNYTIITYTGQILNTDPDTQFITSGNDRQLFADLNTPNNATESNATFTFTVTNINGTTLTVTEDNLTGPNVFVDTIPPNITLIGSANGTIVLGSTYADPGATAKDGDPNYSGTYTATVNPPLDTSILGAVFVYTYTADADNAGNLGDSISRTVTVVETEPITINSLSIASSSGTNYANAGKIITLTLVTDGSDLGNITGTLLGRELVNDTTGGSAEFTATVVSGDDGNATFSITVTNSSGNQISISNIDIKDGSYVTIDTIKPEISLLGTENITLARGANFIDLGAIASDASYENIIVYSNDTVNTNTIGTYTLNYTAPADGAGNLGNTISRTVNVLDVPPLDLEFQSISPSGKLTRGVDFSSDYTFNSIDPFKINDKTYALVTNGFNTNNDFFILDITNPALPSVISEQNIGSFITHDSAILTVDGLPYGIMSTFTSRVNIYNLSNPASPSVLRSIDGGSLYPTVNSPTGVTTIKIGSTPYILISSQNTDKGVQIVNATFPDSLKHVSNIVDGTTYPVLDGAQGITTVTIGSSQYALVAASVDNGVQIINITDPYNPSPASSVTDGTLYPELDGAWDVTTIAIDGSTYALVAAKTDNGVQIINITDPYNPSPVSSVTDGIDGYDTLNAPLSIVAKQIGLSTYAFVASNGDNGIQVIDITDPQNPLPAYNIADDTSGYTNLNGTSDIALARINDLTYVLVTSLYDGLQIISVRSSAVISTTSNPDQSYAKAGDTLGIAFTVNDTISSHAGQILELTPNATITGTNYNATVTVPATPVESNITFAIQVVNAEGTTLFVTESAIPQNSRIFIDTIAPEISLIGNSSFMVPLNSIDPSIPGVIITDGDPNYPYTFTTVIIGTLDTSVINSTVTYTYTAAADGAGNAGPSITRTVTVSNSLQTLVTSLGISGTGSDNFARAGQTVSLTLVLDSFDPTSVSGTLFGTNATPVISGNTVTLSATISDQSPNGDAMFTILLENARGNILYVTNSEITDNSYVTIDTIRPAISLRGTDNVNVAKGAIFTDPGAIASDASYENIIVYSSDTVNTNTIGTYTLTYAAPADVAGNPGNTISRTVNVLNVAQLALETKLIHSPSGILTKGTDFSTNIPPTTINLFETSGKTYALLTEGSSAAWIIADVTNPALPSIVFNNTGFIPAYKTSIFTIDNTQYAIAAGGIGNTSILDISSPASPSVIATLVNGTEYPRLYNAQSVTTVTIGASTFALFASASPTNGVQIIDVTNPLSPSNVSYLTDDTDGYLELGGAFDITTVTIGASVYALVASNNDDGVQIINITDPYNPSNASSVTDGIDGYDELDGAYGITTVTVGSSVYALVASFNDDSIQIINITDPYNPSNASSVTDGIDGYDELDGPYRITTVTVGSSVYALTVSIIDDGVQIIDITDPYNPQPTYSLTDNTGGYVNLDNPRDIITATINGKIYAFIASNNDGLQIIKLESLQSTVNITSNNANLTYAKTGDTLTVQFTVNNIISSHTSQILGLTPSVTLNGANYNATLTVPSIQTESYATFAIQVANAEGTTLFVTESAIPQNSRIFIDTIAPRISLIGSENHNILQNNNVSSIPNVTVTDGDPNYAGTFSIATNATLDTSVLGSVVLYTYTAAADGAGNAGSSVTRTVTVVDFEPITINSLTIASSSGNNYANAGKNITVTLATDSSDLDNINGTLLGRSFTNTTTGGSATFTGTVQSGDDGDATFSITVTNSTGGQISVTNADITDGSYVTIDTTAPSITLKGANNTRIATNSPYTDPGATATDASYATSSVQVSGAGNVNTTIVGNYTLTYTAPVDPAGNTGSTITRNVIVQDTPPININTLTLTSNNQNAQYAKADDTLTLMLVINDTITSDTVIIQNGPPTTNSSSGSTLTATRIIPTSAIESDATFTITVTNANGATLTVTQDDLIGSNVFVDTIPPTITPDLPQIITVNDTLPVIRGDTDDGDLNYNSITLTCDTTHVNHEIANVYPVTCTANNDPAGNPGSSATTYIDVRNVNGTTILNSSHIDSNAPIVQNPNGVIMALIHNDSLINPDNQLKLHASTLELNTFAVTSNTTSGSTVTHTTTYPHPLDLMVNSKITVKIERNTTMTFNTNNSNPGNFIIREIIDNHNDDAVRLGFENTSYALTGNALELTFSVTRSSFDAFVRNGTFDSYVLINRHNGTIDDASSALTVINGNASFSGVLYTYDSTERTVTIWTSHLSDFKVNTTSSGGSDSDSDSNAPTLGKTSSGAQLVTNGFEYNGLTVNVGRYHTEFPLIGTNVGDINTIKMKIYDSAGPEGIKRVEVALGVPDVGLYHEAEAFVEVWMQKDSIAVKEIVIVDKLNLLEDSDVSSTVSQISCTGDVQQCLLVELKYSYREPPIYNTVSIKPVDWDNNAHQFYFNDGIHVDGDSINLPKEIDISTSHATGISNTVETLHLVQIDRAEHLWVDQYGYQWMIIGNTVRQITTPEYVVPDDNTYGTLHGPDRNHPDFASTVYAEQKRAQETLAEILGHATIIKPLPENGGTIYFDATGTDSRKGDSFKLVLELETARMQQLSNLLYDDSS